MRILPMCAIAGNVSGALTSRLCAVHGIPMWCGEEHFDSSSGWQAMDTSITL